MLTYGEAADLMDDGIVVVVIFLEYSKAFDAVYHSDLWPKLRCVSTFDRLRNWICWFLIDRGICVSAGRGMLSVT